MIELHRPGQSSFCDDIEEEFADMMVRYKRVIHSADAVKGSEDEQSSRKLPYIDDGKEHAAGEEAIRNYMDRLKADVKTMNEFTSDACYIDPDTGDVC